MISLFLLAASCLCLIAAAFKASETNRPAWGWLGLALFVASVLIARWVP